eukprot:CAMPEP_0178887402 /NCGR_PEP_ID=MMETSP0747-20121128/16569_1 /TAXON_ID=913974 /ORGANISM="Nitzschia punctata, Strain CCMP561" /LENGTH=84 /DNA_ID=CAMNT_0020556543 /DNA_START=8 /DNA_END=259 /DNA_ORIENTATION=+
MKLFQTDPGGGLEQGKVCAAGKQGTNLGKELQALVDDELDGKEYSKKKPKSPSSIPMLATKVADAMFRQIDSDRRSSSSSSSNN